MRLTVDINGWDAAWEEKKHPRGQPGNSGQFGSSSSKASNKGRLVGGIPLSGGDYPVMRSIHKTAIAEGSPADAATKIKVIVGKQSTTYAANYANKVLRALEKKHNLAHGSLGIAEPKTKSEKKGRTCQS